MSNIARCPHLVAVISGPLAHPAAAILQPLVSNDSNLLERTHDEVAPWEITAWTAIYWGEHMTRWLHEKSQPTLHFHQITSNYKVSQSVEGVTLLATIFQLLWNLAVVSTGGLLSAEELAWILNDMNNLTPILTGSRLCEILWWDVSCDIETGCSFLCLNILRFWSVFLVMWPWLSQNQWPKFCRRHLRMYLQCNSGNKHQNSPLVST